MQLNIHKLFVIPALAVLILPLSASSAFPPVAIAATIAGVVWTGVNVLGIGARSAAVARADEIWVSDPPSITPADVDDGALEWSTAQWNRGRASSVSIAPASAPSGNAITVQAETNWEQEAFSFSSSINVTKSNFANPDGILWGKGYAFGTFEGIVTREWQVKNKAAPAIAKISLRYILSDIALPYADSIDGTSLDIKLHAWKLDDTDTEAADSSWNEQIILTSVSLNGPDINYLEIE